MVAGSLFLASSALALEPKSSKPTIIKPDWHYDKYVKETTNDLLKPQKIEYMPVSVKEQVYYEVSNKFEVVPMQYEHATYEKYDPDADYVDENEYSSEPELNSSSDESESSSNGDAIADDDSDSEPSISDGNLTESVYTEYEGSAKWGTSDLKLPEFGSLIDKANEATPPSDPENTEEELNIPEDDSEEVAELDTATTTVKAKIVLQYTEGTFVDGTISADLLKDGAIVISSASVSFSPSETVAGKGTVVVEFDSSDNFSFDDFDNLILKTTDTFNANVVSYSLVIGKEIAVSTSLPASSAEETIPLSFVTDTSDLSLARASAYTTSLKVKHVLQYEEGQTYEEGSLDSTISNGESNLAELGTGEKTFKASSSVEGKGTLTVYYSSSSDIDFNRITEVVLKTNGDVLADLLKYSIEIEKKVKPSGTTFTPTEESNTLSLLVF